MSAILILRLETLHLTLLKLFEQKHFLSNCSKQLVTPVNLTRKKNHELFNFQDWEHAPKAKKLPFIEVISAIVSCFKSTAGYDEACTVASIRSFLILLNFCKFLVMTWLVAKLEVV